MWALFFTTTGVALTIWSGHEYRAATGLVENGKVSIGVVQQSTRTAFEKIGKQRKIQVHYYPVTYDGQASEIRIPGRELPAGTEVQIIYDTTAPSTIHPYHPDRMQGFGVWDWLWRSVMLLSLVIVALRLFYEAVGPAPPPKGHGA